MAPSSPFPNEPAPALSVATLSGKPFTLSANKPAKFTIVVFYRGSHCPICTGYLKELEEGYEEAKKRGIDLIAISMDSKDRALKQEAAVIESLGKKEGEKLTLPIGYGLPEEVARSWGLYISPGRPGTSEPAVFSEPALFVLKPDSSVYFISIQNAPFARPNLMHLLGGLDYVVANDYPTRGTLTKKN
jgi:alkyl hydroperoxide reductase subunit AhpC